MGGFPQRGEIYGWLPRWCDRTWLWSLSSQLSGRPSLRAGRKTCRLAGRFELVDLNFLCRFFFRKDFFAKPNKFVSMDQKNLLNMKMRTAAVDTASLLGHGWCPWYLWLDHCCVAPRPWNDCHIPFYTRKTSFERSVLKWTVPGHHQRKDGCSQLLSLFWLRTSGCRRGPSKKETDLASGPHEWWRLSKRKEKRNF